MKKQLKIYAFVAACMMMAGLVCACGDDDDNKVEYNKTYVKYKLSLGSHFQKCYDVTVTYCDMAGNYTTKVLPLLAVDGNTLRASWDYKDEKEGDFAITFGFKAVATLKEDIVANDTIEDIRYDLSHTSGVYWYEKSTKAMAYAPASYQVDPLKVSKKELREYLEKHPVIDLMTYPNQEEE